MEPYENDELIATLDSLRPQPRPEFVAELDARAAAGFPRRSRLAGLSPAALLDRVRAQKPRRVLLPAGAVALTTILVAAVVISQNSDVVFSGGGSDADLLSTTASEEGFAQPAPEAGRNFDGAAPQAGTSAGAGGERFETEVPMGEEIGKAVEGASAGAAGDAGRLSSSAKQRAIERSAQITLGTAPENVGKASSEVFDVVHASRGIVLRSQTSDGAAGRAGAEFELLIPSGKLGDAMAGFSAIAEVRSRHEATDDITAPTVSAGERLEDSQARIDSLLAQLADAETEGEREAVEAELRGERRRAAALRASLQNLERRADLSRVALRIESGEAGAAPDEGGAWGVGDALDDAGRLLAVGAGVALLGLAVLGPLALIALLVWLARRTYLRRARRTALG